MSLAFVFHRSLPRRPAAVARKLVAACALSLLLFGCGGDATTGHAVSLKTRITTDLAADHTFTTGLGWSVTLTKAALATGPFYYFDGEPAITQAPSRLRRWWAALSPIGIAHAHPGHYIPGNAVGQMLLPFSADLLATPVDLPDGTGITGLFRSGTFSFSAPTAGAATATLGTSAAVVEGTATKADKVIHFRLAATLADVAATAKDGEVTGCQFAETEIAANGTVTVTVKPRLWFNLVDFSELPPGTAEAPSVADPSATAYIAFSHGLAQLSAYQFAYATP